MITPTDHGLVTKFGLGFHVSEFDGHKKIGHGGAVYGFSTQLASLPERRLGVVAASSLDGSNGVVRRLSNYALRLMLACQDGQTLPDFVVTGPVPPQRARELVGRYRNPQTNSIVQINELGGDVFMRRGQSRYTLRTHPENGRLITDDESSFGIEVQRESDGTLVVGGTRYERMPDVPPPSVPERWRGLVGEYGWDHNTLYILEDHGRLFALIEWFYYYPLEEIDRDTFAFPDTGLYHGESLKFERDSRGVAKRVVAAGSPI